MFFALLSHLWLHEPQPETIARAGLELGLPPAEPMELASAYADVLLLNVYPYGTAFTDPAGELNGPAAQRLAGLYERQGYHPPELNAVGAPDHLGLCLGFLAHLDDKPPPLREEFIAAVSDWLPVCCLAVEREPSAHPFYRALAASTRDALWASLDSAPRHLHGIPSRPQLEPLRRQSEEEVRLRDIVRFFLAPARCGAFLSRSRWGQMARTLGLRLPFGSRFEVAETLFASAGEADQLERLLAELEVEIQAWAAEYRRWGDGHAAWRPHADAWLARTADAVGTLADMRQVVRAADQ